MPITQKTIDFLIENRLQNNKLWFDEHRQDFNDFVIAPLAELVTRLTSTMLSIDELLICQPKVDKSISRVYRDVRFSKDKSLYREEMWISFIRQKKLYPGYPGFFFEVSPYSFRYGGGFYQADTQIMNSIRKLILNNDKSFQKALKAYEKQEFFQIVGEMYKKTRHPEESESLKNWLDRKSLGFINISNDFNLLFSESLCEKLSNDFLQLKPIHEFLLIAESRK